MTISDSLFLAATSVSGASILSGVKTEVEVTPLQQPLSQAVYVLHSKCGSVVLPQALDGCRNQLSICRLSMDMAKSQHSSCINRALQALGVHSLLPKQEASESKDWGSAIQGTAESEGQLIHQQKSNPRNKAIGSLGSPKSILDGMEVLADPSLPTTPSKSKENVQLEVCISAASANVNGPFSASFALSSQDPR